MKKTKATRSDNRNKRRRGQRTLPLPAGTKLRHRSILRDFFKGLLFIALVGSLKFGIEHTPAGNSLERAGYDFLQRRLSTDYLPVVVLDISKLEPAPFDVDGVQGIATPRDHLKKLLQAVVEQDVRAIGIDIDFSPDAGYVTPRDPEFFQFCLNLEQRSGVPVVLGIFRTESLPPSRWLGVEEYSGLAASISIPRHDTRKMLKWIRVDGKSGQGRTLAAALAERFQASESRLLGWLHEHGLVEQVFNKELKQGVHVAEFFVDYSSLKSQIEDRTLATINPEVIRDQGHRLRGKIVLLGRAALDDDDTELFNVASRDQQIPGVFLHASAVSTLTHAPLYELTGSSRLAIDLILSVIILLSVIAIRLFFMNPGERDVSGHKLQIFLTWVVVVIALTVGVMFVTKTRLMWSDFVMVLGALVLHPYIEQFIVRRHQSVRRLFARWQTATVRKKVREKG